MTPSIACCINVYNDAYALRGLLEQASRYFDNIFVLHTGPGGARSTDGTIELCQSFGIAPIFEDMNKGFGVIRSRLIHDCGCEWAFVLDADERFFPLLQVLECDGTEKYPDVQEPKLTVREKPDVINQGAHLKNLIQIPDILAVRTIRRHWLDFSMKRPAQNWQLIPDYQLRIVRNHPAVAYRTEVRMHEHLYDNRSDTTPVYANEDPVGGPFHERMHVFNRRAIPGHKEYNESNYSRLERGEPMLPYPAA